MSLLARLLGEGPTRNSNPNTDSFWWNEVAPASSAGPMVTPESALTVSAVFSSVRLIAESVASLPLPVYRRMPNGGKQRAPFHPLYSVLHDRPNRWQTAMEFREMLTGHVLLRGNAYAQIVAGPRGFADQLVPLNPARMEKVERLENGRVRYHYRRPYDQGGELVIFEQEEIFHLRGYSYDGLMGLSIVSLAREAIGLAMATEGFGARLFAQNARPGGVLEHPGKLDEQGRKNLKESWQASHAGLHNAHKVAVLEEGMKWHQIGMTSEDAQFLETRKFQIAEIARWFRVPPHKIGDLDRSTNNNIEHQGLEFVTDTLRPWLIRWEQAISRDLILAPETYFAEHLVDGLLRGDAKSRNEAYAIAVNTGWMTRNEVRIKENMNPLPGLDEPLQPLNMTNGSGQPAAASEQVRAIALEAAGRVLRKEVTAVSKAAQRYADDPAAWQAWLEAFYSDHVQLVMKALALPQDAAETYCNHQRNVVLAEGVRSVENWETDRVHDLAALALGEKSNETE